MANKQTNDNVAGKRGPGRPKGSQNKVSQSAKEAIQQAAEGLGGSTRLVAWAKEAPENERAFWSTIYTKLITVQISGEGGGPVPVAVEWRVVDPRPAGS